MCYKTLGLLCHALGTSTALKRQISPKSDCRFASEVGSVFSGDFGGNADTYRFLQTLLKSKSGFCKTRVSNNTLQH